MEEISCIKPISNDSIHRICSGQVVLTLSVAVKELLENSLDAGATHVEIKLRDYGLQSFEVRDNGSGVRQVDFISLTMKHHTSKMCDFLDLYEGKVSSFGFRGEALSSLCALSGALLVHTWHESDPVGNRLMFDRAGNIVKQTQAVRPRGTTVIIDRLFEPLPVRRKLFEKAYQREYQRLLQLISAYCLICCETSINLIHQRDNGIATSVLRTHGQHTLRDNVVALFGASAMNHLLLLDDASQETSIEIASEFGITQLELSTLQTPPFQLRGFVSSSRQNCGRSAPDRQFFYVNGRPCELARVARLANEIYRTFNRGQVPMIVMNVCTSLLDTVDVNLTPDKRQLFLQHEKHLLAGVKCLLTRLYTAELGVMKVALHHGSNPKLKRLSSTTAVTATADDVGTHKKQLKLTRNSSTSSTAAAAGDLRTCSSFRLSCLATAADNVGTPCLNTSANETHNVSDRRSQVANFSFSALQHKYSKQQEEEEHARFEKPRLFRAGITPSENEAAVDELQRVLDADALQRLRVVGQFNLGFVIVQLDEADLFILDQHAADEKANFEALSARHDVLRIQPLIAPLALELAPDQVNLLEQHLRVFKANGFQLNKRTTLQQPSAPAETWCLLGVPQSRSWTFGRADVDELLFMLSECSTQCHENSVLIRPSRVRAMLASRACRASIMVGRALSMSEMRTLVRKWAQLQQPWHCPHGRPTLRHLVCLDMLQRKEAAL